MTAGKLFLDSDVFARVLRRHVSQGEIDDVLSVFPEEMRPVLAG